MSVEAQGGVTATRGSHTPEVPGSNPGPATNPALPDFVRHVMDLDTLNDLPDDHPMVAAAAAVQAAQAASAGMPEEARQVDPDDGTGPYYWLDDVPALLRLAGSPEEWVADLTLIVACESGRVDRNTKRTFVRAGAVGDGGASKGVAQLDWPTWSRAAVRLGLLSEADFDRWGEVLVNLRGAIAARTVRGRFGGGGGWSCADLRGIE